MAFIVSLARLTALEARRTRLFWLAAVIAALALGLALFLDQIALTESREIRSALLGAALRLAAVFVVATFAMTSAARDASDKIIDLVLSLPRPRAGYFLGKLAGCAAVALAVCAILAVPLVFSAAPAAVAAWWAALVCEVLIVTAVALFCVLGMRHLPAAFAAVAGFYFLSRSMSTLQTIAGASIANEPTLADRFIGRIIDGIALVLPSLDEMVQTQWLIAGPPGAPVLAAVAARAAVYTALVTAAGLFDLYRREL